MDSKRLVIGSQLTTMSLVAVTLLLLSLILFVERITGRPQQSLQESLIPLQHHGRTKLKESHATDDEVDSFKESWQINKALTQANSLPFFEGDLVLYDRSIAERRRKTSKSKRKRRAIVQAVSSRWPFGIVPYEIDPKLAKQNGTLDLLDQAFEHFHNSTCIRFRPKTENDTDYVLYVFGNGCWSRNEGRLGGKQEISLGEDCGDQFGTVVHETAHALGFRHEQNRPDRNRYIRVIEKNIERDFLGQFNKSSDNENSSLGYAYDYRSIMHYEDGAYSDRGNKTIKVIGVGKKHQFEIGQRERLSDIDIAQLNDMYNCHRKAAEKNNCRVGWVKFRSSCYGFFVDEALQFYPASRTCGSRGSHLVSIESEEEDDFLRDHLRTRFPAVDRWRTGGVRLPASEEFVWYRAGGGGSKGGRHGRMVYRARRSTAPGDDEGEKPSLVLVGVNGTQEEEGERVNGSGGGAGVRFEWGTEQTGSRGRPDDHRYPIICETKAKPTQCFENRQRRGRDYRGRLSYTSEAVTCQRWTSRYPHNHTISQDPDEGIGDHNFCRNPNGQRLRPWCYTLLKNVLWQYCDVTPCNSNLR